jgi:hypothetical protein
MPRARPARPARRTLEPLRSLLVTLIALAALVGAATQAVPAPASAAATCGTADSAVHQPTTASSTEAAGTPAASAIDGDSGTRWSSAFADPQWIQVDLGASKDVCGVRLAWEAAYATAFQIQVSANATDWTTVYSGTKAASS